MKRITFVSTVEKIALICLVIIILSGEDCDGCFSPPIMAAKFFICGFVIIIGGIYFTKNFLKTEGVIFDVESVPLIHTDEAVDGVPFAGEGIVESGGDKTLISPYANIRCVYFHSIKEKYVSSGKSGKWVMVENITFFLPFYIRDGKGRIKVDPTNLDDDFSDYKILSQNEAIPNPKNSEIDCDVIYRKNTYFEGKSFFGLSVGTKYRRSEFVLRPGTKSFVFGMVSKKNDGLVLHEDERCPLIISKKNRDKYVEEFYRGGNLIYLVHFLIVIGYTIALFSLNYFLNLIPGFFFALLLIGNAIIAGSVVFSSYNRIIMLKNRALNSLSNIDVELKRRWDLIPNLVEAVKGYAKYEKEVQQITAEARAKVLFSKEMTKEEKPVIPSLVAVIENYPNLKSSENFQSLMRALVDTEERIAYSREFYNRSVRKYNTLIQQFPFLLISLAFKIKQMDFIIIARGEKTARQILI